MYIFNVCDNLIRHIKGIENIHPRKQRDVAAILSVLKKVHQNIKSKILLRIVLKNKTTEIVKNDKKGELVTIERVFIGQ